MKKIRTVMVGLGILCWGLVAQAQLAPYGILNRETATAETTQGNGTDTIVQLTADAQGLTLADPYQIPIGGTFWTITPDSGQALPYPCLVPGQSLPTYALPNGTYLVDDSFTTNAVTQAVLEAQATTVVGLAAEANAAAGVAKPHFMAHTGGGFPGPGGSGGTNTYTPDDLTNSFVYDYGTNLFIAQEHIASGYLEAIASNTISDVEYQIMSWTNLHQTTNWVSQGFFLGSETTNWTPINPLSASRTNNFFVGLRSWIDSDGIGIPDWWQLEYFGYVGINPNAYDSAGDGYTIYQKYLLGIPPNQWYAPLAPQSTVTLNTTNNLGTFSWLPSPGPVTNYLVTIYDYTSGLTITTNVSPSSLSVLYNFTADIENAVGDYGNPNFYADFLIEAQYAGGNSLVGESDIENRPPPIATLINGPNGRLYIDLSALPSDLSELQIYRQQNGWDEDAVISDYPQDYNSIFNLASTINDGYFFIPAAAITNGLCQIPDSQVEPYYGYFFAVQTIRSNGVASAWAILDDSYIPTQSSMPFVDARRQLKDNLQFLLRAAADSPMAFQMTNVGNPQFTGPGNYVYAGFYASGDPGLYEDSGYFSFAFSGLRPFHDNFIYKNFVFNESNVTLGGYDDGWLETGIENTWLITANPFGPIYTFFPITIPDFPEYYFNLGAFLTNATPVVPSSQLSLSATEWILPPEGAPDFIEAPVFPRSPIPTGTVNDYGLPLVSEEYAYVTTNNVPSFETVYPGQSRPGSSAGGLFYQDIATPGLVITNYYFAWLNIDPMPEMNDFSMPSGPPLMIQGIGTSQQIAGYAQLSVTNGYTNFYGYLGQYFDQAYEVNTNGVVTTNSAGVISPSGNFFPTEPGQAALVTMPDIDTGERGTCMVSVVSLQLDANHDGTMDSSYNGADATSAANPMRMWINNNYDRTNYSSDDGAIVEDDLDQIQILRLPTYQQVPDYNYVDASGQRVIPCTRDLADFARLWAGGITPGLISALPTGSTITLSWSPIGMTGSPTIDLFSAANPGIGFQTNETVTLQQINPVQCPYLGRLSPTNSLQFTKTTWPTNQFIWCGVNYGNGGLNMTIADASGNTLAQTTVYIQLVDIKQMYERWTVGDSLNFAPMTNAVLAQDFLPPVASPFEYTPPQSTNTPYILFVHGWNMTSREKDGFAETAFKRLYWQGYQGRFGLFKWPTGNGITSKTSAVLNYRNFDSSESNSWGSARGLLNKLHDFDTQYPGRVYLMAHSMGNVAAGEAMRLAGNNHVANTYIAMQGAISAHCYDPSTPERGTTAVPDFYAAYWTNGAPCYFNGSAGAGAYVNFYNTNDYALDLWTSDEDLKPDFGYTYSATYSDFTYGVAPLVILNFPTNTYQIFAFGSPARSFALGAQADVGGVFAGRQIDLQSVWPADPLVPFDYSSHYWHSGEFRGDYPQQVQFWRTVLGTNGFSLK